MQLIGCHIEGFGKLTNFDIFLTDGMNAIEKENGWGKSTLAAFIRVMFFGFENETKRDEVSNERKRYLPWDRGAVYGGSLCFTVGRKKYRIERYFDEKKGAKDRFFLYDEETKLQSSDYSEKIGEELFEIDRESFRKTIFIGQKEIASEATAGISAKIGEISDWVEDLGNYEMVEQKLKEELNALTPERKTGELKKIQLRLEELYGVEEEKKRTEKRLLEIERSLLQNKEKLQEKEEILAEIREKMKEESLYQGEKALLEKKQDFLEEEKALQEEKKRLGKEFSEKIPTLEAIDVCMEALQRQEMILEKMKESLLTEEEWRKKLGFEKKFLSGLPKKDPLLLLEKKIERLKEAKAIRMGGSLSLKEQESFERLQKKFQKYIPDQEEIERHILEFEKLDGKKRGILEKREVLREREREWRLKRKKRSSFFVLGGSIVFIGLGLLFFNFYLAFFVSFMGISCFVPAMFIKTGNKEEIESLQEEYRKEEEWIANKQEELCHFLEYFSLPYTEEGKLRFFYELKQELIAFYGLKERKRENERLADEEMELLEEIRRQFSSFGIYHISEYELEQCLHKLKLEMMEYEEIRKKERIQKEIEKKAEESGRAVENFFSDNGIERKKEEKLWLREVRDRVLMIKNIEKMEEEVRRKKEAFLEENKNFNFERNRKVEYVESMKSLSEEFHETSEEMKTLYEERSEIEKEILGEEKRLEELEDAVKERREIGEKRKELEHRYEILKNTKEYLEKARLRFVSKYVNPIQDSFQKYYEMMATEKKEFEFDANLSLTFREKGEKRDLLFLSEGYQAVIAMGRRMAMVDAMYKGEKPFLIMDDPFVSLDEEHLQGAKAFLKEISKQYQVLYFYCHESRKM